MKLDTSQALEFRNYTEYEHDHDSSNHPCYKDNNVTGEVSKSLPGRWKLFNKVVTQSDIKHYRLSIPKNQVKKHFRQHFSTSSKGASLCMEDKEGHIWKFRLSFWKSCQGYMITQEWNRFVQKKSLRAGDTVSFLTSTGPEKRLFIDSEPQNEFKARKPCLFEANQNKAVVKLFGVVISTTWQNCTEGCHIQYKAGTFICPRKMLP